MSLDINLTGVEKTSNKKIDLTDNSDTFYPTQKAVKTAVDAKFNTPTGTTAQYLRGDGSLETFPTIPDASDFVEKSDFTSHSILAKQSGASDPVAVSIGNNEFLGRKSGGGSDIEGLSVSEVKAILNYTASDVGAVATNSAITGATKTKITYDAKGLVIAGADATTADIADSLDKRYVTDANLTVIGNTSGTNTGDQDLSGLVPNTRNITINGTTQDLSADRTFTVGNPFPLFGAGMGNVVAGVSTRYFAFLSLASNAAENQRQIVVPYAVTFKNFFCFFGVGAGQPATGSLVLTIRKNGVDTAITLTIPAGSSIGTYSDTTNSVSFVAGDLISVKAVNNASLVPSGNITSISLGTI